MADVDDDPSTDQDDEVDRANAAPQWDDLKPVQAQASAAPNWDDLEPVHAQTAAAPNWDDLQPVQSQPAPSSAPVTFLKEAARSAIPTTLGAIAGLATGAATSPFLTPLGGAAAGIGAAGVTTYAAQKAQDAITDALGITDPAQQAADVTENPKSAFLGDIAPAAITFGTDLGGSLAARALSGGIMGGLNIGQQYAETGAVDPTQAALATGAGALLGKPWAWAEDASGALAARLGGLKGGTQVNPNAEASSPEVNAVVTKTPTQTSPSAATAFEHGTTPGTLSDQTENPAAGMEATPGGFNAGISNLSRDQGKTSPAVAEGVPGAPSTVVDPIQPGIGGQDTAAALRAEQPEVLRTPNSPPEGQNSIQGTPPEQPPPDLTGLQGQDKPVTVPPRAPETPPDMAGLQDRRANTPALTPYTGEERRIGAPGAANPDDGLLQASQAQREAAAKAPSNVKKGQVGEDFMPEAPKFDAISQRQQFQKGPPPSLNEATTALEKSNGTQYQQQPSATQKVIDAVDDKLGRVPLRARNAFEDWANKTFAGKIFNPGNIDQSGAKAQLAFRSELGDITHQQALFEKAMTPEIRNFVGSLSPEQQEELSIAMQQKNPVQYLKGMPGAEPFVQAARKITRDDWNFMMKKGIMDPAQYEENYFPQMWKNENDAAQFLDNWRARQGSKSGFMAKQIPDIAAGKAAGLELKYPNPIEALMVRRNMNFRYQMLNKILQDNITHTEAGKPVGPNELGVVRSTPQPGDIQLTAKGIGDRKLYAPEGFATVFNNHYSPGWRTTPAGTQVMDALQPATSWGTSLLLGLSAFHGFTMTNEGFLSRVALGMNQLARDPGQAIKTLATSPLGARTFFKAGGKNLQQAYLDQATTADPHLREIVQLMKETNFPVIGHSGSTLEFRVGGPNETAKNLNPAPAENVMQAFGNALKQAKNDVVTDFRDAGGNPIKIGTATLKGVGAAIQAISHPLFGYIIPQMKAGVMRENLGEWLLQNKGASEDEKLNAAIKIGNDVENRFGLMTRDNLFINNKLNEAMQVTMTSPTWTLGFMRGVVGGTLSGVMHPSRFSMKSPNYDPRIGAGLALGITVAIMNSAYQYMKTGEPPESLTDLMAPQTGGHTKSGPERALLPGFQKDIYGWLHDPVQEAENKVGIVPRTAIELATNKGWTQTPKGPRYGPIANENDPFLQRLKQYGQHVLQNFSPISVQQATSKRPGSNISLPERLTAIRPAPQYLNGSHGRNKYVDRDWKQAHGQ